VEKGIPLRGVFGEPGTYMVRQIVKEGIYGYRVYGNIDYFGVDQIPIDSTVFCITPQGNTSKFNNAGWEGSYGCVEELDSLLFPENNSDIRRIDSENINNAQLQQASLISNAGGIAAAQKPALDMSQSLIAGVYLQQVLQRSLE
jgi:hypothetical protein